MNKIQIRFDQARILAAYFFSAQSSSALLD
jgi:hypothetical protein